MGWIHPVPAAYLSQDFGPSPLTSEGPAYAIATRAHDISPYDGGGYFAGSTYYNHFHAALDLAAVSGTPIYAAESGVVLDAKWGAPGTWANGGGWFVRVLVNENCMYLAAHCSELLVSEGQHVKKGETIALVGATGVATGNHCHFWVRLGPRPYYDPAAFFYDPALILPGGQLYGDDRFSPSGGSIPDTGTSPSIPRVKGLPKLFKNLSGKELHVRAFKPLRDGASTNAQRLETTDANGWTLRAWGQTNGETLGGSDNWYFGPKFIDGKWRVVYSPKIDIRD